MARRRKPRGLELDADINVVNLIDVMMLLMVIFMITAPMMQGGVDVALPQAEARPLEANSGLVVTLDQTGAIFVDDAKLSYPEFRAGFKALASKHGASGGGLYLRADGRVPYEDVARVLAVMKNAGVGDVGMVVEPESVDR
jgi:biopolymer transport protein ExbD/biopolymer transport protein TolR